LWEDFYDVTLGKSREHEPRDALKAVKQRIAKSRSSRRAKPQA